jgi:para-nitrobenzyl esterase
MKSRLKPVHVGALALASVLPVAAPAARVAAPLVTIGDGRLEGARDGDVEAFKGIPFAAPPVGALRWRAPQPPARWTGIRAATAYGADCMQEPFPRDDAPLRTRSAEDCLYLNVWRPAASGAAKLPVIVWIYGGGFVNGGTSPAIYDGSAFARDGIVTVSFNYRLGRFGFFGFPALTAANADGGRLGNYAVMDMIAALHWVRANIAAFGGDPDRVTIFGESAGGSAVNLLLTSPESRGLFQRAIIQSGGGRKGGNPMRRLREDQPDVPSSETLGVNFARGKGIAGTGADTLAALRALPGAALVDGLMIGQGQPDTFGGPTIDGRIVAEPIETAIAAGRAMAVPIMAGANSADIGSVPGDSKDALFAGFGPEAAAARAAYDPDGSADLERIRSAAGMSRMMLEPARFESASWARQGRSAWAYRFSYTATPRRAESPWGAPHATEIPFIMDTVGARYPGEATAQDQSVARTMHAYWANFAKHGDPNGTGLAAWPAYEPARDVILEFEPDGDAVAKPDPLKPWLDVAAAVAASR